VLLVRIAHISDLHVLSRTGAHWRDIIFNKRLTGYANLILRRGRVHRREYLLAVLSAAVARADHLVVTGDITNLSLEHEYEEARALLDEAARRTEVTVVPGNHDIYLPSTHRPGVSPITLTSSSKAIFHNSPGIFRRVAFPASSCADAWRSSRYPAVCPARPLSPLVTSVMRNLRHSKPCSHTPKFSSGHRLC